MPLLIRLFDLGRLRAVVTLTYHLPDDSNFVYTVEKVDEENDFKMYSSVQMNN